MSTVGFLDDTGQQIPFPDVLAGKGIFSLPRPLVTAIARGFRPADHYGTDDILSATTLINPPQIVQLGKRWDTFVSPLDNLWSMWGTGMHKLLEDGNEPEAETELRLIYDFEGQKIAGTIDRYINGKGQDWKFTSAYSIKQMVRDGVRAAKPEYFWQAQIYKYLLFKSHGVSAGFWEIVTIARDYNARQHAQHFHVVERIPVQLLPITEIEQYIRERVTLHKAAEMVEDVNLPECSPEENWQGRRCASYCAVAPYCHQANPSLSLDATA